MQRGGLNDILNALLDNNNKHISNQELKWLLQKIENDATEIGHAKYGLDEKMKFNIEFDNAPNDNLIGRQSLTSLECIRQSIKKNLELMNEDIKTIFQSYLTQCGERFVCERDCSYNRAIFRRKSAKKQVVSNLRPRKIPYLGEKRGLYSVWRKGN
jgi:hypothetical protein